jgi:hypothetical protein
VESTFLFEEKGELLRKEKRGKLPLAFQPVNHYLRKHLP